MLPALPRVVRGQGLVEGSIIKDEEKHLNFQKILLVYHIKNV